MVEPAAPIGRYVPIRVSVRGAVEEGHAYLPDPLPTRLDLATETWTAMLAASTALGELSGAVREVPSATLTVRPTIRREAVATSALEGTYALLDDVFEAEVSDPDPRGDVREVVNYVHAAETAIARLHAGRPISLNLVHELHGILMRGVRHESGQPGRVRTSQVLIGSRYGSLGQASHIPPPPGPDLHERLHAWEEWIHQESVHPLIRAGLGHYQFEVLHPYADGNGRIGRLVIVLQLIEAGLLPGHLMAISPYLEARRSDYLTQLADVTATGRFDPWLEFFCDAVTISATDALERVRTLRRTVDEMKDRAREDGLRGTVIQIIEQLMEYPLLTVTEVAERCDVTFQAANSAVGRLVERGLLREITGQTQNRVFASPDILQLLRQQ